jgi:hypothetical protein
MSYESRHLRLDDTRHDEFIEEERRRMDPAVREDPYTETYQRRALLHNLTTEQLEAELARRREME